MKILLTGGTGFVGKHLVKGLLANDFDVALLSRTKTATGNNSQATLILLSDQSWKVKVKEFNADIVIHLASYLTSLDDENAISNLLESNLTFGTHLLDAIKDTQLKLFVNTGTFAEYDGEELSPAYLYAATKTAFRSLIKYYQKRYQFKCVNVIPYTIYGGVDTKKKLIDYIYSSTQSDDPINMSPGEQVLDFIHIDDVVAFYLSLVTNYERLEKNSYDAHLGTGIGTSPKMIASLFESKNLKVNITWGGIPYRVTDTMYSVAPPSELNSLISYAPEITIKEGINLYLNTINQQHGL